MNKMTSFREEEHYDDDTNILTSSCESLIRNILNEVDSFKPSTCPFDPLLLQLFLNLLINSRNVFKISFLKPFSPTTTLWLIIHDDVYDEDLRETEIILTRKRDLTQLKDFVT